MSRIGKKPIVVHPGVDVNIDGTTVTVKGPKGTLKRDIRHEISAKLEDGVINVTRDNDEKESRSYHGLTRTLIANMIEGVSTGYKKELEISGVGYRAAKQGEMLVLNVGYSHQVTISEVDGITVEVPAPNKIIVSGPDKQKVGQFASEIRGKRPPEPYHGKGIKYAGEYIRRKEGKAGKGGK